MLLPFSFSVGLRKLARNGSFDRKEYEEIVSGLNIKKKKKLRLNTVKNLHALFEQ